MRAHFRAELLARGRQLEAYRLVLLTGPGGSGKTTLARAWQDAVRSAGGRMAWLGIRELHQDPIIFVEDWVEATREVLPGPLDGAEAFGASLLRSIPRQGAMRVEPIVRLMQRELKKLASPLIICLDAFEHLESNGPSVEIIDALLRLELSDISWVILSRGLHPMVASRMLAEGQAVEIDARELSLRSDQIQQIFAEADVELEQRHVDQLLSRTEGWPIAIRYAARALSGVAVSERSGFIEQLVRERSLFRYIASELIEGVSTNIVATLEAASILGPVDGQALASAAAVSDANERIEEAINLGLLQVAGNQIAPHELLGEWMRARLRARLDADEWRVLHQRLGSVLEDLGRGMEALRIYRAAGLFDSVAALISQEGQAWVNGGHYELADEALQELPEAIRRSNPALIAVEGIIAAGRNPDTAIENLKRAIDMYRKAGNRPAEFEALHELAIIAVNANRIDEVQGIFRYALSLRRVILDQKLRGMFMIAVAGGTSLLGRFGLSLRLARLAATYEHAPRESAGLTLIRSTIHFYQGEWDRIIEEVDERCADDEQRKHGPGFFAIQTLRCSALALRGQDVSACQETLRLASQMFVTAGHHLNQMNSEIALGQIALRTSDFESAIEHFSESAALANRIELHTGEAASFGMLARTYQRAGNLDLALEHADLVLARLEKHKAKVLKGPEAYFWAPAMALGALVHAELAGGERALRALAGLRSAMLHRELPFAEHAVRIAFARIDEIAGQTSHFRKNLKEGWRVYRQAGLRDQAPEIDQPLWEWATEAAIRAGVEPGPHSARGPAGLENQAPTFEIRSLGGLSIQLSGRAISDRDWRGQSSRRLLVRLLVADGALISRERIEADLWPEANSSSARNNMNVGVSRLRNVLEPRRRKGEASPYIRIDGESLGLTEEALKGWDVRAWNRALAALDAASAGADRSLSQTALDRFKELNRGAFVPEFLDDWSLELRRALEERWLTIGRSVTQSWLEHGDASFAVEVASLVVQSNRDDEAAWECLADARLRSGDRSGALRVIKEAKVALELGHEIPIGAGLKRIEAEIRG